MFLGLLLAVLQGMTWAITGAVVGLVEKRGCGTAALQLVHSSFVLIASALALVAGKLFWPGCTQFAFLGSWQAALLMFLCGVLAYCQGICMGRSMALGPNGLAWTITQSCFIFPFALGILSGNTPISFPRLAGIACVLGGVAASCEQNQAVPDQRRTGHGWLFFALSAFLMGGANQCAVLLVSYLPDKIRPQSMERMFFGISGTIIAWLLHQAVLRLHQLVAGKSGSVMEPHHTPAQWIFTIKISAVNAAISFLAGTFLLYRALDCLQKARLAAVATPLMTGSCFLCFAFYSRLFLHERHSSRQIVGFLAILAGLLLLACPSGK